MTVGEGKPGLKVRICGRGCTTTNHNETSHESPRRDRIGVSMYLIQARIRGFEDFWFVIIRFGFEDVVTFARRLHKPIKMMFVLGVEFFKSIGGNFVKSLAHGV